MKALVYCGPQSASVQEVPVPNLNYGEVLVKPLFAGICGSDRLIFSGKHPRAKPGLIHGHEFYGIIEKINSSSENFREGDRVVCYPLLSCGECTPCKTNKAHICKKLRIYGVDCHGGVSQFVSLRSENLIKIPDELRDPFPALLEPLSVAVHAVKMSNFKVGDCAVILGGGPIGILVGLFLKKNGAEKVVVTQRNKFKLKIIDKLGLIGVDTNLGDSVERVLELTGREGGDVLFECSGSESAVEEMTEMTGVSKQIIMVSLHKEPKKLDLMKLVFEEQSILGVRVYTKDDFREAIDFAVKNQESLSEMITEVVEIERAGEVLNRSSKDNMKVLIKCNKTGEDWNDN
jgi:2-desacetyl-2-hydroxyethyl bacteriochlorophyllide A dehydrogenase